MTKKNFRPTRIEGNVAYVSLTMGHEAIIDAEDLDLIKGRHWYAHKDGKHTYAEANGKDEHGRRIKIKMHSLLTGFPITDHIDGNGLNNRRRNLREATKAQNSFNRSAHSTNRSGLKGVISRPSGRFRAEIRANGVRHNLGNFGTAAEAHDAYCRAAAVLHGSFARHE